MFWAQLIVYAAGIYLAIGALFAVRFVVFGVARNDEAARGAGVGFRFVIFWGALALWPAVWLRGRNSRFQIPDSEPLKPKTEDRKPKTEDRTIALRRRHRLIWLMLAVALPLVLAAGIAFRHEAPVNEKIPENPPGAGRR